MEHYQIAALSSEQLQKVKQLEEELQTILIAYDNEDDKENANRS